MPVLPPLLRRVLQLLVGLFLYGIAIALMIRAAVGIPPWDVLGQGVALRTGLSFGLVSNLVGVAVLLLWIPIRQRPGVGTVLNAVLVGPAAEVGLHLVPEPGHLAGRIALYASGVGLLAVATGLYLGARFGPGPRDGLMTGLHDRFGWRVWKVRGGIEGVVLAAGWLLGGDVGVGTLVFALVIGPLVHRTIPPLRVP